ncbi:MAG TPA: redoxin domain-containing protein [Chloroflexia bacterium]|nr:redoxin domain-containing protein [Chloroflexia bacterium]
MSKTESLQPHPGFEVEIQSGGRAYDDGSLPRPEVILSPARAAAKARSQRRTRLAISLGVGALTIFLALMWLTNPNSIVPSGAVARVNGEYIFQKDIDREIDLTRASNELSNRSTQVPSAGSVLEDLINRKLQLQDARKAGVKATSEETDKALTQVFGRTGISQQKLELTLGKYNLKLDDIRGVLADTLVINKYIAGTVIKGATSEQDAQNRENDWKTNLSLASKIDRLQAAGSGQAPRIDAQAPDFTLKDINGKEVKLSSLRGKPVMLNFWATWCPPCRAEIPVIAQMYSETHKEGTYEILGVATQSDTQTIAAFAKEFGMAFPVLPDDGSQVTSQYHVLPIPTTFFIDKDGIIRSIKSGPVDKALMQKYLLGN